MNQKCRFLLAGSFVSGFICLFFTFFTLAWFSDASGIKFGFEIPVGTANGPLSTLADLFWMLAPFSLLASSLWSLREKGVRRLSLFAPLPLALYAVLRLGLLAFGQESHAAIFVPLGSAILLGLFGAIGAFLPEARGPGAALSIGYVAVEILLLILSPLLETKLSFYYFFQLIPLGHSSIIHYSFFVISSFFFYTSHGLALFFLFRLAGLEQEAAPPPPPGPHTKEPEAEEADLSSLTLEDLGISR